ncbi:hypothetical protein BDW60DRAFT_64486 [Aspergillus nidulans var. acristatus]
MQATICVSTLTVSPAPCWKCLINITVTLHVMFAFECFADGRRNIFRPTRYCDSSIYPDALQLACVGLLRCKLECEDLWARRRN